VRIDQLLRRSALIKEGKAQSGIAAAFAQRRKLSALSAGCNEKLLKLAYTLGAKRKLVIANIVFTKRAIKRRKNIGFHISSRI
jgi:hypothetical protein